MPPELPRPKGGSLGPELEVRSPNFEDGAAIPETYTCEGADISPGLEPANVPPDTVSLALVVDDPDAPQVVWVHWVAWNIDPSDAVPAAIPREGAPFRQGTNDFDRIGWDGPCPPRRDAAHHYHFRMFAADVELDLDPSTTRDTLYRALDDHVLAMGERIGTFDR